MEALNQILTGTIISKNQRIRTEKQVNSTYKVVEGSRNGFSVTPECVVSRMTLQDGILEVNEAWQ